MKDNHPLSETFDYCHALAWATNAHGGFIDEDTLADYAAWYAEECADAPEYLEGLSHQTCWDTFVREFDLEIS